MEDLHRRAGLRLHECREALAEQITVKQYERQPELLLRFGERGRSRTLQDALYNLRYLSESVQMRSPLLFTNYIHWLRTLLEGYKVTPEDLLIHLECMREELPVYLEPDMLALVMPFIEQAIEQVSGQYRMPLPGLEEHPAAPYAAEAERYTQLLLQGSRHEAAQLIMECRERMSIEEIYIHIFQQSQYEIGRLWQTNRINVAQEHYCTAATQMIMSQLYPYIFTTARQGRQLVAACVGDELHEIGLRMVSDFFEMDGWDTYYLGANVPTRSIIETIVDKRADVMAISATMTYHVNLVRELIQEIRRDERSRDTRILVGGLPFNIDPDLWKRLGADCWARDAKEAVACANELVSSGPSDPAAADQPVQTGLQGGLQR